jgi:acyl-coenzyme A synthetase/AMP-(fatty) acid ligase
MNILLPIRRHAQATPDRVAVVMAGKEITYDQLMRYAALASSRLAQAGVSRGDTVALSIGHPGAYLFVMLGVARLGAVVTPFDVKWPQEQASAILGRHKVRALVRDFGHEWRHPGLPDDAYLDAKELLEPVAQGTTLKIPELAMDVGAEPWVIALSSGTTGTPKSIPQTHERAVLYACMTMGQWDAADMERVLVFASPHLSISMNAVLHQLIAGRSVVLMNDRTPEQLFVAIERDRPTRVMTSTGTAIRLGSYAARFLPDSIKKCQSVRVVSIAGSAASPNLREQLAKHICPNVEINYGSSEAGRIADATPQTIAVRPESAGRLFRWVEMEAVDESGRPLPPGTSGALRLRTPVLTDGYLGNPEATARAFRDGWFYPGDMGSVDKAGYLTLTGRVDELLNLGGNKVDPFIIEAALEAQPGVEESVVVAVQSSEGTAMLIALVVMSGLFDEAALKKACLERVGPKYVPRRIRRTESIPRNEGGKIMRKEIAARIARLAPKSQADEG